MSEAGFFEIPVQLSEETIASYVGDGWSIFSIPAGISSKADFFREVRLTLPLDPPLSGENWDAFADSLWSGLDALPNSKIMIVWPDTERFASGSPDDAQIAMNILADLPISLASEEMTAGNTKKVAVVRLI